MSRRFSEQISQPTKLCLHVEKKAKKSFASWYYTKKKNRGFPRNSGIILANFLLIQFLYFPQKAETLKKINKWTTKIILRLSSRDRRHSTSKIQPFFYSILHLCQSSIMCQCEILHSGERPRPTSVEEVAQTVCSGSFRGHWISTTTGL